MRLSHVRGLSPKNKVFQPTLEYLFFLSRAAGVLAVSPEILLRTENLIIMQIEKVFRLRVSLCIKIKAPRLVKVKAYKRYRYGKTEKVRSHYRYAVGR